MAEDPIFERNKNFKRDMFNVAIGTIWQTALEAVPTLIAVAVAVICAVILKRTWSDKLPKDSI